MLNLFPTLGVVPILVNTGAAVLPAVLAALTGALALLFKPRELLRIFKAKPHIPILLVLVISGLFFGVPKVMKWMTPATVPSQSRSTTSSSPDASRVDWTRIALELIRQDNRTAQLPGAVAPDEAAVTDPVSSEQSLIFRGDAARSGFTGGVAPANVELLWEYHPEDFAMILSSPLGSGDVVYGASTLLDPPQTYGSLFAVDARNGQRLWQTQSSGGGQEMKGFFSSPALTADGTRLLIGQGLHDDSDCDLLCIDAQTGELLWKIHTPLHVESSPAIEGDIVVVGAGAIEAGPDRKPQGDPQGRGHPGFVFGARISTGEKLWEVQINDPESSPAIRDGIAYIGSGVNGNEVVAIRIEDDQTLASQGLDRIVWRVPTPYPAVGAVTLVDDLVLIGCGNSDYVFTDPNPSGVLLALDQQTGQIRWSVKVADSILGPIATRDRIAVAPVRSAPHEGRRTGQLLALDLDNEGDVLWEYSFQRGALALAGVALTETRVYAVANDGHLVILDARTGTMLEEVYTNHAGRPGELGLSIGSPFVAGGKVMVGTETGGLRAYIGGAEAAE